MAKKIYDHLSAKPDLMAGTAFIITFDEGGGFYDSGYTFSPWIFLVMAHAFRSSSCPTSPKADT